MFLSASLLITLQIIIAYLNPLSTLYILESPPVKHVCAHMKSFQLITCVRVIIMHDACILQVGRYLSLCYGQMYI